MFLWTETGLDTLKLAERALEQGLVIAPGSLFSPHQHASTKMRINIAAMTDPAVWSFLQKELGNQTS
jgi:DNA-binding transcriptional MocR family regulator